MLSGEQESPLSSCFPDGATTTGRPDDAAAQRARISGVPVSTIAFGTPSGTVVLGGETLSVPPDGSALRAIADATGGRFFEAASGAELAEVCRAIGRSVTTTEELRDLTTWFVGAALAALLVASALALAWFARLLINRGATGRCDVLPRSRRPPRGTRVRRW